MQLLGALVLTALATLGACVSPGSPGNEAIKREPCDSKRETFRLTAQSELRLSGTATIGSWRSASRQIDGRFAPGLEMDDVQTFIDRLRDALREADGEPPDIEPELSVAHPPAVTLAVPVASLRSGKPGMERDMRNALRAEEHPHVTYTLERVKEASWLFDEDARTLSFELLTQGRLLLAGVERQVDMAVHIEPIGPERFRVIGRRTFDMPDFDIEPPTALFGLIRADEKVEVVFDLTVQAHRHPIEHSQKSQGRASQSE